MDSSTITAGEITSYSQWTDHQNGKLISKINKEIQALSDLMDLIEHSI